ncbi:MAG: hypothetical protein AW07_00745 [Candidatus Accumulibacter sp. SK-11]|nr:MAG: hypothetical protein AW07_00745 [Candidatus Accumulibacter sp. SK-11]
MPGGSVAEARSCIRPSASPELYFGVGMPMSAAAG